jgi:molybdate transport system substrate-binding protein
MNQPITRIARLLRTFLVALPLYAAVSPAPTLAQATAEQPAPHAAAADLQFALPEILAAFTRSGGAPLKLSFGSSGNFARQIMQGAPFELFLAADDRYIAQVIAAQRADGPGAHYATGRLALFLPQGSPIRADRDLADLAAAIRDGRLKRLAIANPEHAPYGRAAREVLEQSWVWLAVQASVIPLSLACAPKMAKRDAVMAIIKQSATQALVQHIHQCRMSLCLAG